MFCDMRVGPYRLVDARVVYDRTVMQLAGGAAVCRGGDVLAYWNRYTDAIVGNEAHFLRSRDHGRSWEMTGQPLASAYEEGSVHVATGMAALDEGTLLLPFADYQSGRRSDDEHPRHLKNQHRPGDLKVAISRDDGHRWERIVTVDRGPFRWSYPYGRIIERGDGSLILPAVVSRTHCLDEGYRSEDFENGFFTSPDRGLTWGGWQRIVPHPNEWQCVETTISRCADGKLLAIHRNRTPCLMASRSNDEGQTWTDPEATSLHGECSCLFADRAGRLLAAYRSSRGAPSVVPVGLIMVCSEDGGKTWTKEAAVPDPKGRVHGASHETGMPDIVQLPTGEIAVVYYSYDPNLPWRHPRNESIWDPVIHFWKRYLAVAIFAD